jgi:Uma2 family endonuclease
MSKITSTQPGPLYRMTVDEYDRIADAGALDDERIELIDGLLVSKVRKSPAHVWSSDALWEHLRRLVPAGWFVRTGAPVRLPRFDEPEPDLSVIRGTNNDYRARHPGPEEIALVVEVGEASLDLDQGPKRGVYARAGIPGYWIVNLVDRQVEVYSRPSARGYRSSRVYKPGEDIPVVIAGSEVGRIAVADILP